MATGTTGIATYKDILTTYVGGNLDVSVSVDKATTLTEVNNFNTTISNKAKLISASQPNNITSQNYTEQQCVLFTDIQALPIYYFNYVFKNSLGNPVSCDWAMNSWSGTNESATGVFSSTTVSSVTLNITPKDNAYKPRTIQKTGSVPADAAMQIPNAEIITLESYPSAVLSAATTSQTIQTGSDSKSITFTIKGLRVKNLTSSFTHSNSNFSGRTCTVSFTNNNALTGETLSETTVTFVYGGGTTALAGLTDNVTITISGTNMNDNSSKELQLAVTINQYGLGSITGKTDTIPYTGCTNKSYAIATSNIKSALSISPSINASFNGNNAISASGAIALAVGIAIQNFPEGAIISAPLAASGTSKGKAFACGTLSGVAEPVGAILTILVTSLVTPVLPYILAFAAGAMIYVVIEELIPESRSDEHSNVGTVGAALGFALMMLLDVALG